jgi:hypothetical protein
MNKVKSIAFCLTILLHTSVTFAQTKVLIIQDEREQMEVLSSFLTKSQKDIEVHIVDQNQVKPNLSEYDVVILYIHRILDESTENRVIDYTKNGGRFICLHHSISSGKAKNKKAKFLCIGSSRYNTHYQ